MTPSAQSPYCPHCMQWRGHKATCPAANGIAASCSTDYSLEAYEAFLRAKVEVAKEHGYIPDIGDINPWLKPHQKLIVQWAVTGGRRAIFAAFGLGKTVIQLETIRLLLDYERSLQCKSTAAKPASSKAPGVRTRSSSKKRGTSCGTNASVAAERSGAGPASGAPILGLIVAPLGVRQEFKRDAQHLGIDLRFVRTNDDVDQAELFPPDRPVIYLTNYESVRDGKLNPAKFTVTSLDEAAVLRGFGGTKTFREFMRVFETVKYRFVATATPDPNEYIELLAYAAYLGIMDVSQAKAQPLDAKVLTPYGWTTMGELKLGDEVIAGDGTVTKVVGIYPQGERPCFRVTFSDGGATECDVDHLWVTMTQYERNNERRRAQRNRRPPDLFGHFGSVRTTSEIAATLRDKNHPNARNHSIPIAGSANLQSRPVLLDPWLLGVLIGDGCLRQTSVTVSTADEWILKGVERTLPRGLYLRKTANKKPTACDYGVTATSKQGGNGPHSSPLLAALRTFGLLGKRSHEKRVPKDYLFNDSHTRLSVLQGLMDTDGTVTRFRNGEPQCSFTTTSAGLAEDVQYLARSLGGTARVYKKKTQYTYKGEKQNGRDAYSVILHLPAGVNPFTLPRKAGLVKVSAELVRYVNDIQPAGTKPMQCIMVDHPDHLYVTDDFAVTHNTRFFKRDSTKADKLTIHPHKVKEFWTWVATWGLFLEKPSELGFSDEGYVVPDFTVVYHEISVDHTAGTAPERDGQMRMYRDAAHGVVEAAREKRDTLNERIAKMREILDAEPNEHFLLWHDLEAERHAIKKAVPEAVCVWGSMKKRNKQQAELDNQERAIISFADGDSKYLAGKPQMLGSGCNLQRHCARAIYVGIGYKFNDFIQSIHRIVRYLQGRTVVLHIIYAESEKRILESLLGKWARYKEQSKHMSELMQQYGLSQAALIQSLQRSLGVERVEVAHGPYRIVNSDSIKETAAMPENSVDLILTSIPFSTQYEYSPNYADLGHTDDNEHFWRQMDFLTPQLLRVLRPGRLCAIHVKDRIVPGGITGLGFQTVYPFHADGIRHYTKHGFAFMGMKTIVTDVVRENNQTYRLGWSEQCKDGTKMGYGMEEYLLLFRKPPTDTSNAYADKPVSKEKPNSIRPNGEIVPFEKGLPIQPGTGYSRSRWQIDAHGFARSSGNRPLMPEDLDGVPHHVIFKLFRKYSLEQVYDYEHHVHLGEILEAKGILPVTFMLLQPQSWHPNVWTDITRMRTLNGAQSAKGKEMHLCPMQLDLADRVIRQNTEEGETVYDPFGGLGTVPARAVRMGRRAIAVELSPSYFLDSLTYVRAAAEDVSMPTLFDLLEAEEESAEPETASSAKEAD